MGSSAVELIGFAVGLDNQGEVDDSENGEKQRGTDSEVAEVSVPLPEELKLPLKAS